MQKLLIFLIFLIFPMFLYSQGIDFDNVEKNIFGFVTRSDDNLFKKINIELARKNGKVILSNKPLCPESSFLDIRTLYPTFPISAIMNVKMDKYQHKKNINKLYGNDFKIVTNLGIVAPFCVYAVFDNVAVGLPYTCPSDPDTGGRFCYIENRFSPNNYDIERMENFRNKIKDSKKYYIQAVFAVVGVDSKWQFLVGRWFFGKW